MKLLTCNTPTNDAPGPFDVHPCNKAIKALDAAGHSYEQEHLGGYKMLPWTVKDKRARAEELSGQKWLPILVLDDETVITGSNNIIAWAQDNAPTSA